MVELTVDGQRQMVKREEPRGDHISWMRLKMPAQIISFRCRFLRHVIADKDRVAASLTDNDDCLQDTFMLSEAGGYFAKLDTEAAYLYLAVETAKILEFSVIAPHLVAGSVDPVAR